MYKKMGFRYSPYFNEMENISMLKRILTLVGFLMFSFALIVSMQPSEFKVTRSIEVRGAPQKIFDQINTLKNWDAWSPWAKIDPQATVHFAGPEAGIGSNFSWKGNDEVGEGTITISESVPSERIQYSLVFTQPFTASNTAQFSLIPKGESTEIIWSMWGENNFMAKAFSLFFNCDSIIGPQFEKGLHNIKAIVENNA